MKSCLLLGAVPFFLLPIRLFYHHLHRRALPGRGMGGAVQYPRRYPFFYFVFLILYYAETQSRRPRRENGICSRAQLQRARKRRVVTLRQLQECTNVCIATIWASFLLSAGPGIQRALGRRSKSTWKTAQSDMDAIIRVRFCENETANLIFSAFSNRAEQVGVLLSGGREAAG